MRVRELMSSTVVTLMPHEPVSKARDIMARRRIRHIPIVNKDGAFLGLVSHRDILAASVSKLADVDEGSQRELDEATPLASIMATDVLAAGPDMSVRQAAKDMLSAKVGCLPVLNNGALVGILTEADFLKLVVELLEALEP